MFLPDQLYVTTQRKRGTILEMHSRYQNWLTWLGQNPGLNKKSGKHHQISACYIFGLGRWISYGKMDVNFPQNSEISWLAS